MRLQLFKASELNCVRVHRSKSNGAATPASNASFQPVTQTHHRSPSFRVGKVGTRCARWLPERNDSRRDRLK
jgi:hypothetical protein